MLQLRQTIVLVSCQMYIDLIGLDSTSCRLQAAYAPQGSMKRRAELAPMLASGRATDMAGAAQHG